MKKHFLLSIMMLWLGVYATAQDSARCVSQSLRIFEQLRSTAYQAVVDQIDTTGRTAKLDSARLGTAWRNLLNRSGKFMALEDTLFTHQPTYDVVVLRAQFETKKMDIKTVFGSKGTIKGIFFLPTDMREKYVDPPYYKPELLDEVNTEVVNGKVRLKAILTVPKKQGKCPVVILVHGSGPNDKDESVGATKIFRDFAVGLAAQGVAVLRYDKRTRAMASELRRSKSILTPEEETILDAVAAMNCVKSDPRIDTTKIYYAGHAMGAYLLPEVIKKTSGVKGLILLSPHARPLEDVLLEQTDYIMGLEGSPKQNRQVIMDSLQRESAKVKSLQPSNKSDSAKIMGIFPAYWLYLNSHNSMTTAASLNLPMLFVFAGRDYQTTSKDESIWKSKMKVVGGVNFKNYSTLNHFYIKGNGKSTPDEYMHSGNVEEVVIKDMASWMNAGGKTK
jgi:dienelactone hydrolase